jgi:hypothetical protein
MIIENADTYSELNAYYSGFVGTLRGLLEGHHGFIAGGVFKDVFEKKDIRDIDIWFENEFDWKEAVEYFGMNGWVRNHETENSIGFRRAFAGSIVVELINNRFGTPEEIINSFDFTVCQCGMYKMLGDDADGNTVTVYKLIHDEKFFQDLRNKTLHLTHDTIVNPVGQFDRVLKYSRYGFKLDYPSRYKLLHAIHDTEMVDIEERGEGEYPPEDITPIEIF